MKKGRRAGKTTSHHTVNPLSAALKEGSGKSIIESAMRITINANSKDKRASFLDFHRFMKAKSMMLTVAIIRPFIARPPSLAINLYGRTERGILTCLEKRVLSN